MFGSFIPLLCVLIALVSVGVLFEGQSGLNKLLEDFKIVALISGIVVIGAVILSLVTK